MIRAAWCALLVVGAADGFMAPARIQNSAPDSSIQGLRATFQPRSRHSGSAFGSILQLQPQLAGLRMVEDGGKSRKVPAWLRGPRLGTGKSTNIFSNFLEPSDEESKDDPPAPSFMRLVRTKDRWFELQCAVVTYAKRDDEFQVDLVPMVHIADPSYFQTIQDMAEEHDRVLFELITSKSSTYTNMKGRKRLKERLYAPRDQLLLASANGLQAQMEGLDYSRPNWVLADLDKDTIVALQAMSMGWGIGKFQTIPRRAHNIIRQWLRGPVWLVPCPEGAMLCLDWALSSRGTVSEVLTTMLDSLLAFDLRTIRKLSFAQTVIISERNAVALAEVQAAKDDGCKSTALLYGGLHGPDLDQRLRRDLGMERAAVKWMPAWKIAVPPQRFEESASRLAFAITAYLGLAGFDWMSTICSVAEEGARGAWDGAAVLIGAYFLRHGVVYWQLGRWLVAWDQPLFVEAAARLEDGARMELSQPVQEAEPVEERD